MNTSLKKILLASLIGIIPNVMSASDDGPRMYWNAPVGTNILQAYFWTASGNSISPENTQPQAGFDTDINIGCWVTIALLILLGTLLLRLQ